MSKPLSPHPARDSITPTQPVSPSWELWFLNLFTVVKDLVSGLAAVTATWLVEHRANGTHDWRPVDILPFDATAYSGGTTMTWTVTSANRAVSRYARLGQFLWWNETLLSTTVAGTPTNNLRLQLPAGLRAVGAYQTVPMARCLDNGVYTDAFGQTSSADPTWLYVYRQDAAPWTASAGATNVQFSILLEVEP